jgi:preprotein translocase SecE subunit
MDHAGGSASPPPARVARPTIAEFLRQCIVQLRKVLWPDGRTVRGNTKVLLLTVIVLVVGLGALELAVSSVAGGLR